MYSKSRVWPCCLGENGYLSAREVGEVRASGVDEVTKAQGRHKREREGKGARAMPCLAVDIGVKTAKHHMEILEERDEGGKTSTARTGGPLSS